MHALTEKGCNRGNGQKVREDHPIQDKHRYHTNIFGIYQLYDAELQSSTPCLLLSALQDALKLLCKVLAQDDLLPSPVLVPPGNILIIPAFVVTATGTSTVSRIQDDTAQHRKEPFDPTDVIADVTVEQG